MRRSFFVFLALSFLLVGCPPTNDSHERSENAESKQLRRIIKNQKINLSIFLDVSDMIDPKKHPNETMDYYKRDIGYIEAIINAFQEHLSNARVAFMDDKVQLFIDPLPGSLTVNSIIDSLKVSFDRDTVTREGIDSLDVTYADLSERLYEQSIEDNNFIGSDIWGFFRRKVNDYCISDNHRNIVIIFTDGYIYHRDNLITDGNKSSYLTTARIRQLGLNNSNWENTFTENQCGFIINNQNLGNLEVLVLGINAYRGNPFEEDVIRAYWSDWLSGMGIEKYAIKTADLPSNLDGFIKEFILTPR